MRSLPKYPNMPVELTFSRVSHSILGLFVFTLGIGSEHVRRPTTFQVIEPRQFPLYPPQAPMRLSSALQTSKTAAASPLASAYSVGLVVEKHARSRKKGRFLAKQKREKPVRFTRNICQTMCIDEVPPLVRVMLSTLMQDKIRPL